MTVNPQQILREFPDIHFDSRLDSGNLMHVDRIHNHQYSLYLAADNATLDTERIYKAWFFFKVSHFKKYNQYIFTIKNIQGQYRLFQQGMTPVVSIGDKNSFKPIRKEDVWAQKVEGLTELTIKFSFTSSEPHYFAFTYPWSYHQNQKKMEELSLKYIDHPKIYFHREILIHTLEGRNIEMLTITSHEKNLQKKENQDIFPQARPFQFDKPYVFISARVHPGEVPASHCLNGVLKAILDEANFDILNLFVFCIVPMINPDGVYRGHWRTDTLGQNLNRFYQKPSKEMQPSIFGIDTVLNQIKSSIFLKQGLFLYLDMHAHSGKKGIFIYGNSLEYKHQVQSVLLMRLIAMNAQDFDYECCNFTEKNMYIADRSDGLSKEGSGRVQVYKKYKCQHSYTIECNYTTGRHRNFLYPKQAKEKQVFNDQEFQKWFHGKLETGQVKVQPEVYTVNNFLEVGKGICDALLEIKQKNQYSRIPDSPFVSFDYLRYMIAIQTLQETQFRQDQYLKTIYKGLYIRKNFFITQFQELKDLLNTNQKNIDSQNEQKLSFYNQKNQKNITIYKLDSPQPKETKFKIQIRSALYRSQQKFTLSQTKGKQWI